MPSSNAYRELTTSSTTRKANVLNLDTVNPAMKRIEYAVRGPLVMRANELQKELAAGAKKPFDSVIKANVGDAHAMGNRSITFLRQVLALVTHPALMDDPAMLDKFPPDAISRARTILEGCNGGSVGSYSESTGIEVIRKHVASYIERRDGGIECSPNNVVLCAGASDGIRAVMKLLISAGSGPQQAGVMIPIPQYPLYSATLAEYNLAQVGYYLKESDNWALDVDELERSFGEASARCKPVALVVINPGNPTGSVLSEENIKQIIQFAKKHNLFLFADEVYQDNVYAKDAQFHSVKKVMMSMGEPYSKMELASFMSCSKGYMGECGIRGGYVELCNMDSEVRFLLNRAISAKLCPTVVGQACMDVIVNPPQSGEPSYEAFIEQKEGNLKYLAERAKLVAETLNTFPGIKCNEVRGAMYAFPQIMLPANAVAAAKAAGQPADVFYAFALLEATGICVVPGSGFGQMPDTYHFRTTILPQRDAIVAMLDRMREFHVGFMTKYSD